MTLRNPAWWTVLHSIDQKDRKKVYVATTFQVLLSILDLLGVALIGVIGALSINGIQSKKSGDRVEQLLSFLNLQNFTFQTQVAILGLLATGVLISKTILSILISRRILNFLSSRSAQISRRILKKFLHQDLTDINRYSQQEIIYASTHGVQNLTTGVIAATTNLIVDASLLVILFTGLAVVSPSLAISTLLTFLMIGVALNYSMRNKAFSLGSDEMKFSVESNEKIWEILNTYREATVRNTRDYYVDEIGKIRLKVSSAIAQRIFMPYIGKYVMEISMIVGALAITGTQFYFYDATAAITGLTLFMAATTRIAPAILRIQQGLVQIKNYLGNSAVTIELLSLRENPNSIVEIFDGVSGGGEFEANVSLDRVCFKYESDSKFEIINLSLDITHGEHIALVGPSGSGKTTLVDIVLGVVSPSSGSVMISGHNPIIAFSKWPQSVSYVPQLTTISNRSLRENILLGLPIEADSDVKILRALERAGLENLVDSFPEGLDTILGDNGFRLSGGQRQRIGIARALYTSPTLLVMDEATSALDATTEDGITKTLLELKAEITMITIAHRLSTVRNADRVYYLNNGAIEAQGTFEEVRALVPNFDNQANLMGL
jgi:ATP-binding cassette subfamily C protein